MINSPLSVVRSLPEHGFVMVWNNGAPALLECRTQTPNSPTPAPGGGYQLAMVNSSGILTDMSGNTPRASYLRGTLATILATPGSFVSQKAYATDYVTGTGMELELRWNGSAWRYPAIMQLRASQFAQQATPDVNELTTFTAVFPPLNAGDQILFRYGVSMTSSANNKTEKVKAGATTLYSNNFTTNAGDVRDHFFRLRAASGANNIISGFGNAQLYGNSSGSLQTYTVDCSAQTTWTVTLQRANAGESLAQEWAEAYLVGGA